MSSLVMYLVTGGVLVHAVAHKETDVIAVSFRDHGREIPCKGLRVNLRFDDKSLVPKYDGSRFTIPAEFGRLNDSGEAVNKKGQVGVTCNGRTLDFPDVPATWVRRGDWQVGIDYPPFAHFIGHAMPEKGAWVSYLSFEPDGYDGVEMQIAHTEPLPDVIVHLRQEQPKANGERARDIAFALAVSGENYEANRNYLLKSLKACLALPKASSEVNGCDGALLDDVVNLYWRGDKSLLRPLLEIASFGGDRIDGTFYADVLDRDPKTALSSLSALDPEHRQMVCQLAGEDGFSLDEPEFERVQKSLGTLGGDVALRCLEVSRNAANNVWWNRKPAN